MRLSVDWRAFQAPLRFRFKHASADRSATSSIVVKVSYNGIAGYGEACPRAYVTGETQESVLSFLEVHAERLTNRVHSLDDVFELVAKEHKLIDQNPAAFCAIEMALIDLLARTSNKSTEELLGLPTLDGPFTYSAVIGDSGPLKTRAMVTAYRIMGFNDFKVKLGQCDERDRKRFSTLPKKARVRVDANNQFESIKACVEHIDNLGRRIWAIEEPIEAGDVSGQLEIGRRLNAKIILDESLTNAAQLNKYMAHSNIFVANIRVSKCGGILRSMSLANAANSAGIPVILGAHVGETSLLTRACMTVSQSLLPEAIAQEGGYGNILIKQDVTSRPLRFSYKGKLDPSCFALETGAGNGLEVENHWFKG